MGLLLLAVIGLSGCKEAVDLEADFELGYEGVVKVSEGNPMRAKINNQGTGFEGELQIEVDKDGQSKVIFAKAFEIAPSSEKDIEMYVPVYTIQKNFKVSIVVDGKEAYSKRIVPKKFISPEHTVIAVITDQPDVYRFMNTTKLPKFRYEDDFMNSYQSSIRYSQNQFGVSTTTSVMVTEEKAIEEDKTHILYFESFAEFKEKVNYDFMDYIYIGKTSHLNMNEEVETYLLDWINEGNTLFVETGADYKKIMSQLPKSLINYQVDGTEDQEIKSLDGYELEGTLTFTQGTMSEGFKSEYISIDDQNFGVVSGIGAGQLVTLMVDMTQKPLDEWLYTNTLMEKIFETARADNGERVYEDNYNHNQNYRLSRIPDDKAPPYLAMVLIFMFYIAIVGPIIYAIFKARDKRDYLWVAIPVTSVVCLVLLYIVGLSTRYEKPITNSISTISYLDGTDYMEVETAIALFNNKNSDVTISWKEEENVEFNSENNRYYGNYQANKKLVGKMLTGKTRSYTIYDTPLWTPSYMSANKVLPFESQSDKALAKVLSNKEAIELVITNPTPLDLEYAFVSFGNSLYAIGDLAANETVTVSKGYNGDAYQFFDQELVPDMYMDRTLEGRKQQANIEILRESLDRYNYPQRENQVTSNMGVVIYGLNSDVIGYDIGINDEETEDFSRNVVMLRGDVSYESGEDIVLPSGTIVTQYEYDQYSNGHMSIYTDNNIGNIVDLNGVEEGLFYWSIPDFIDIETIELNVDGLYNNESFYDVYNNNTNNGQVLTISLPCEFALYNGDSEEWDLIDLDETQLSTSFSVDASKYVDDGKLQLRFILEATASSYKYGMNMKAPELEVKGVVK